MFPASMLAWDILAEWWKQGWDSSWTDPPSPRPSRLVFWPASRPHNMSYKVSWMN